MAWYGKTRGILLYHAIFMHCVQRCARYCEEEFRKQVNAGWNPKLYYP